MLGLFYTAVTHTLQVLSTTPERRHTPSCNWCFASLLPIPFGIPSFLPRTHLKAPQTCMWGRHHEHVPNNTQHHEQVNSRKFHRHDKNQLTLSFSYCFWSLHDFRVNCQTSKMSNPVSIFAYH
jgi:hypothetical protein